MSRRAVEDLRALALRLAEPDRAELTYSLVVSLDGSADPGVEQAWAGEIGHRLDEIHAGRAVVIDGGEFLRRMRAATGASGTPRLRRAGD